MEQLVEILKALADTKRLTIVALLAQAPRSGEELAALLKLSPSTISHHLARLQKVGLIQSYAAQYYHIYSLDETKFTELRGALQVEHLLEKVTMLEAVDNQAYQRQILDRWIQDEQLQGIPTPIKQREIVLQWLIEKFTPDRRYTMAQVDAVLDCWCSWADPRQLDITGVMRALVDDKLLDRTHDGSWYWRADSPLAQTTTAFQPKSLAPAAVAAKTAPAMSQLQQLTRLAMHIPSVGPLDEATLASLIHQLAGEAQADPVAIRTALLAEALLDEVAPGQYRRPTIGPDHPVSAKLRAEGMTA